MVGSGGHASLVAVQQPQLGGSGSSTRSHGGCVRQQRVAVVAVRQPQHGVQNPYGRPEQVIKACRSPVLIKRMNQTHHRGSPRAQNRHFCALLPSQTPIFGLFEHKIEVFVRFCPLNPPFSGFPSTKSEFLCSSKRGFGMGKRKMAFLQITFHASKI